MNKYLLCRLYKKFVYGKKVIKGMLSKLWLNKCGKKLLVGKRTELKYKCNMSFGDNIIINDYVEINAESVNSVSLGNHVNIGKYSIIKCTGRYEDSNPNISIGDNFGCGDFCFFGCAGGVKIGNNVIMGQNVRFHAQNHIFDRLDIPIREQSTTQKGIVIGDDCWIGGGTVFLDGVKVGEGCVIGSNSVVTKDIEPYSVAVGNPVKVIKSRR